MTATTAADPVVERAPARAAGVSGPRIRTIAARVLREVFRDHRARALLILTPGLLLVLVRQLFDSDAAFSGTGVIMVGVFPLFTLYLVGSTSIVRERDKGTLEAVLATPARRAEFVLGYVLAAAVIACAQAICTVTIGYLVSGLDTAAPPWLVGILAMLSGVFGMSLGMAVSAVCRNEGQAFQFLPGVMVPQILVSGIVWPISDTAEWVQWLSRLLPAAAVPRAMTALRETEWGGGALVVCVTAIVLLTAACLAGAALAVRRRTA